MARWKPPDDRNPGRDGFTRIPEPGGGVVRMGGMSPKTRGRIMRNVYKSAKGEANRITQETKTNRIEKQASSNWTNPRTDRDGMTPAMRKTAANRRKGRKPDSTLVPTESKLSVRGNPMREMFFMKMQMARKGKTQGGNPKGDNDNRRK